VDPGLFESCLRALGARGGVIDRLLLGRRLARDLRAYQVHTAGWATVERWTRLARWLLQRISFGTRGTARTSGGAIIAFVGPEASGKSTLVAETGGWLRQTFAVHTIHTGKPPASLVTAVPNLLAPTLRVMLPRYRTTSVEAGHLPASTGKQSVGAWLYQLRCLGLAYDRWRLLRRADRLRARGAIVVCDRYPAVQVGFVDGAQLDEATAIGFVAPRLARLERRLYASMPIPDLLVVCCVPLAEALRRNVTRHKKGGAEAEDFVRRRHAQFSLQLPAEMRPHVIDTTQPREQTQRTVRRLVWQALLARRGADAAR